VAAITGAAARISQTYAVSLTGNHIDIATPVIKVAAKSSPGLVEEWPAFAAPVDVHFRKVSP
jgi:hypothetical protein